MIVLNDLFDYGFKIYQNTDYFKFSLDSILLAEYVKIRPHDRIMDLCSGNAAIPLILCKRNDTICVDGIEIQKPIYLLAIKSIQENKLEDRIKVYNANAADILMPQKYDIVTCNPPYFKVDATSQKNTDEIKCIARHEITINLEKVIKTAKNNLKETGSFYLVHRIERLLETIKLLEQNKFGIRNITFIFTKADKKAEFFLIEASRYKKSDPKIFSICIEGLKTYKGIFEEENE